jgi:hypothetical protein
MTRATRYLAFRQAAGTKTTLKSQVKPAAIGEQVNLRAATLVKPPGT